MDLLNQQVCHRTYGTGRIVCQEADMLTVSFPGYGEKRFRYPDALAQYLTLCDQTVRDALAAENCKQELYEKYIQNKGSH